MSAEYAEYMKASYVPTDRERFETMCSVFAVATSREVLDKMIVMYLLDESYSRDDIATADSYVRKLKGWGR